MSAKSKTGLDQNQGLSEGQSLAQIGKLVLNEGTSGFPSYTLLIPKQDQFHGLSSLHI